MSRSRTRSAAGTLDERLGAILDEGRTAVAAGRGPDEQALEQRIRAAARAERSGSDAEGHGAIDRSERRALEQLGRLGAVHRARALVSAVPKPPVTAVPGQPSPAPVRRTRLRTRPTVSGNMDVRRHPGAEKPALAWDAAAAVTSWEVRFSTRPSPRADYVLEETVTLPGGTTSVPVPLGGRLLRVHVFGLGRDGRVQRRAIVSGLSPDTWNDRWERRPTAS